MPTSWTTNPRNIQLVRMANSPFHSTTWPLGGRDAEGTPVEDWQLATDIYVPRKYDMFVTTPRTAEIGPNSAYYWAHPDDLYRRVIGLGMGSWPYKFELINAPTGATIGDFLLLDETTNLLFVPDNYGVVEWTPTGGQLGSTFSFHVRVFDQDYNRGANPSAAIDIQWDVEVSENKFVWLDADVATDGVGTKASPYKFWDSYWVNENDTTHQGKIVRVVGGDFGIIGYDMSHEKSIKPIAYIANPGENPILRQARFTWTGGDAGCDDAYFQGITMDGAYESSTAWYFNWTFSQQKRMVFFENTYLNLGPGPDPSGGFGDNPSAFLLNRVENGTDKSYEYLSFIKNTYDNFGPDNSTSQNGPTSWTSYHTNYCLFEHETMTNMNGWDQAFRFKGRARDCTLRNIYFPDSTGDFTGIDDKTQVDYDLSGDNEMAWCRGNRQIVGKWSGGHDGSGPYDLTKPVWFYRNNIAVDIRQFGSWEESQTVYHSEYNVCPDNEIHITASSINVVGDIEGATFDTDFYLDGTLQNHWRAERGADLTTTVYAGSRPADLALTHSVMHDFSTMTAEDPWSPPAAFESLDPGNGKIAGGGLRAQDNSTFRVLSTASFGSDQGSEGVFDAVDGNSTVGGLRDDPIHWFLHYIDGDNYIEVTQAQGSTGIDFDVNFRQYGVSHVQQVANVADGEFPGVFTIGVFSTWAGDDVTVDLHVEGTSRGTATRENWNKQGVPGIGLTWDDNGIQCNSVTWSST